MIVLADEQGILGVIDEPQLASDGLDDNRLWPSMCRF